MNKRTILILTSANMFYGANSGEVINQATYTTSPVKVLFSNFSRVPKWPGSWIRNGSRLKQGTILLSLSRFCTYSSLASTSTDHILKNFIGPLIHLFVYMRTFFFSALLTECYCISYWRLLTAQGNIFNYKKILKK